MPRNRTVHRMILYILTHVNAYTTHQSLLGSLPWGWYRAIPCPLSLFRSKVSWTELFQTTQLSGSAHPGSVGLVCTWVVDQSECSDKPGHGKPVFVLHILNLNMFSSKKKRRICRNQGLFSYDFSDTQHKTNIFGVVSPTFPWSANQEPLNCHQKSAARRLRPEDPPLEAENLWCWPLFSQ